MTVPGDSGATPPDGGSSPESEAPTTKASPVDDADGNGGRAKAAAAPRPPPPHDSGGLFGVSLTALAARRAMPPPFVADVAAVCCET